MQTWKWLYAPKTPFNWRFVRNVLIKTIILFVALNVVCVAADPLPALGKLSAYNPLLGGRERLPYGENPDAAYNLSLYQIDAMFASHTLAGTDKGNEYRVLLIGDSATWGILLEPGDTLTGQINANDYRTADGQPVRAYNLGYPTMSLTKDLMLLDYAMRYDPDLIVWPFTLQSFDRETQLDTALVQNNAERVQNLIERYDLDQDTDDARFVEPSTWDKTIIGRRRALADLLRLQLYGVPWTLTGIDQDYPADHAWRAVDLPEDNTWQGFKPDTFSPDELSFDVLQAGIQVAGDTPVLLINEPMFLSDGANSDIRYNFFYPRWAYDEYRQLLYQHSTDYGWTLLDLWDRLPGVDCYTDSPVHLTPECSALFAEIVGAAILEVAGTQ
ncbi:MAG: hypothetical protein JXQ72_17680 [Anaerolineae bacterium]|nr:hypothetical protein [Anaerolineae bacterium]